MTRVKIYARILLIVGLATVPVVSFAAYEISDATVNALYHLEDTVDSSGNGWNLTNNGSGTFGAGLLSDAYILNGTSQYLTATTSIYNWGGTQTISLWFKADTGESSFVLTGGTTNGGNGFMVGYGSIVSAGVDESSKFLFQKSSGSQEYILSPTQSIGTSWHHLVAIQGGAGVGMALWFDGSLLVEDTGYVEVLTIDPQDQVLGASNGAGTIRDFFAGQIDEVVITTDVWDATRIAAVYNAGVGDEVCITSGCGTSGTATSTVSTSTLSISERLMFSLWILVQIIIVGIALTALILFIRFIFPGL